MNLSAEEMRPSAELLAENTEMAERFTADGVDLSRVRGMTFMCDFGDETAARAYLDDFASLEIAKIASATAVVSEGDDLPVLLSIELEMGFDVDEVSKVEAVLIATSQKIGGGQVSWEYKRPDTGPQEEVN